MARGASTSQSKVRLPGRPHTARHNADLRAVSHHPPVSAFYYVSPANKVAVIGELRPKSKFLGNSVSTTMEGENRVYLLGRPDDKGGYRAAVPRT